MGLLDRWDDHNQAVMERARTRDITEWTVGAVLLIAGNLLWIVGDLPRWLAFALQAVILVVAAVGIVRIVRRRRGERDPSGTGAVPSAAGGRPPTPG